jgi:uncharacterized repeat protein (TIGR01451 family)
MKIKCLLIPFTLGVALILALLGSLQSRNALAKAFQSAIELAPHAPTAELLVCASGCTYTSIQDAVDAASDGDVIKVATGTYVGVTEQGQEFPQVVHIVQKNVTIRGGYTTDFTDPPDPDANLTTLDAQGQGRVFFIREATVVIEGFSITGGKAVMEYVGQDPGEGGGGFVLISNVTFSKTTIFSNTADYGGGLFLNHSTASLDGNTISANTAITSGGGLLLAFSNDVTVRDNIVTENEAQNGGGVYLDVSDATLLNSVIANNTGEGIYIAGSSPRLWHTTVAHNSGGDGIHVTERVVGNTTYHSDAELVNTILSDHTVGINVTTGNAASLNATLWHNNGTNWNGNVAHVNDQSGDPNFVNPAAEDYHIQDTSAALDVGVDAGLAEDIDQDERPRGRGYDIGADEFPSPLGVVKLSHPTPARAGEQLIYTIRVTNFGDISYTAIISDILPAQVTPVGVMTWTAEIVPDSTWERSITVTIEKGYEGWLTNIVEVTTNDAEVTGGARLTIGCYAIHLPLVLRNY